MRQSMSAISLALVSFGCVVPPPPQPVFLQVAGDVAPDDAKCRDYHAQATVDGQPVEIVGHACQQDDGSWRVTEGPAGAPPQVMIMYPPPPLAYDPWLWDFPIGFSLGTAVVFVDRKHHLHHMQMAGLRRIYLPGRGLHTAPVHPAVGTMGGMHHG
jgi:hypothetical protein